MFNVRYASGHGQSLMCVLTGGGSHANVEECAWKYVGSDGYIV